MAVFLGIDIGTSGTKTLAMQEDGTILASATAEYPLMSPRPGWSEQDPEDWWDATVATVKKVLKAGKIKPDDIGGIGLTGQMHGSVFLDKQHAVIRHALLWNDQRTAEECVDIENKVGGRAKLIEMVANPALTGFTAPKIVWLQKNEPKNYSRTVQILLPKDFVRFRLMVNLRPMSATPRARCCSTCETECGASRCSTNSTSRLRCCPKFTSPRM